MNRHRDMYLETDIRRWELHRATMRQWCARNDSLGDPSDMPFFATAMMLCI